MSIFPNSRILKMAYYGEAGPGPAGSTLSMVFELDGQEYFAMNGGPDFEYTEALSLLIQCKNQEEVDWYWTKLTEGGQGIQCGWLKDKYGVCWQVTPSILLELLADSDTEKTQRVMRAMCAMVKLDIAGLLHAAEQ